MAASKLEKLAGRLARICGITGSACIEPHRRDQCLPVASNRQATDCKLEPYVAHQ